MQLATVNTPPSPSHVTIRQAWKNMGQCHATQAYCIHYRPHLFMHIFNMKLFNLLWYVFRPVQRGGAYRPGFSFASFHHHRFTSSRFDSFQSFKLKFEILKLWKENFSGSKNIVIGTLLYVQISNLIFNSDFFAFHLL